MFVDVRITPEFCSDGMFSAEQHSIGNIMYQLNKYLKAKRFMIASETTNKFGETTHFHYHYKCQTLTKKTKDSIQKWLRERGCKGNKAYSIALHEDPRDEQRWWRYVLKEMKGTLTTTIFRYGNEAPLPEFQEHEIELWRALAVDERQKQIEMNLASRDREINKNQFKDKMFKKLKETHKDVSPNRRELFKDIFKHYQAHGKTPPDAHRIQNIIIDFQVWAGYLDLDDYITEKLGTNF